MENIFLCTRNVITNTRKQIIFLFASGYFTLPVLHPCLPQACGGVMSFYTILVGWAGGLLSLSHSHRGTDALAGAGSSGTTTKSSQGVSALAWSPWGDQRIKFHLQRVGTNTACSWRGLCNKTHVLQPSGCDEKLLKEMYSCIFTMIFSSCPANWQNLDFGTVLPKQRIFLAVPKAYLLFVALEGAKWSSFALMFNKSFICPWKKVQ